MHLFQTVPLGPSAVDVSFIASILQHLGRNTTHTRGLLKATIPTPWQPVWPGLVRDRLLEWMSKALTKSCTFFRKSAIPSMCLFNNWFNRTRSNLCDTDTAVTIQHPPTGWNNLKLSPKTISISDALITHITIIQFCLLTSNQDLQAPSTRTIKNRRTWNGNVG